MPIRWIARLFRPTLVRPNGTPGTFELDQSPLMNAFRAFVVCGLIGNGLLMWRGDAIQEYRILGVEKKVDEYSAAFDDHLEWAYAQILTVMTKREFDEWADGHAVAESMTRRQVQVLIEGQIHNRYILEKLPVQKED